MRKFLKKAMAVMLAIACLVNINIAGLAAEETGNGVWPDCRLKFVLTDMTNGSFGDEIAITLLNQETYLEYNYTMGSIDYLLGVSVGGNVKQGQYSIALSYPSKDRFTIRNIDGTVIDTFNADSAEYTFEWEVVGEGEASTAPAQLNSDQPQPEETMQDDAAGDTFSAKTGIGEADELWNNFLNLVAEIETNEEHSEILEIVDSGVEFYSGYYEEATGRSKDEYAAMTSFERFLWYSTYIMPVIAITSSSYNTYLSSVTKWNTRSVGTPYRMLKSYGTIEMAEAYRELMEWDYYYFMENGAVMNFMTGKTSLENDELEVLDASEADGNGDPTQEEIESLLREEFGGGFEAELEAELGEREEADRGIWGNTIALIKDNALTIIILLILAGATVGVIVYRKRKAIDDEK